MWSNVLYLENSMHFKWWRSDFLWKKLFITFQLEFFKKVRKVEIVDFCNMLFDSSDIGIPVLSFLGTESDSDKTVGNSCQPSVFPLSRCHIQLFPGRREG